MRNAIFAISGATQWWNIASLYSADAPLAVAMGDPAGIGPEIIAKAWVERQRAELSPFFAVGDVRAVQAVWIAGKCR